MKTIILLVSHRYEINLVAAWIKSLFRFTLQCRHDCPSLIMTIQKEGEGHIEDFPTIERKRYYDSSHSSAVVALTVASCMCGPVSASASVAVSTADDTVKTSDVNAILQTGSRYMMRFPPLPKFLGIAWSPLTSMNGH